MKAYSALGAMALAILLAQPAFADTLFSDTFTRANSDTVGNNWAESDGNANAISITNNTLQFNANATLTATQGTTTLSTVGYTNITLAYDWSATNGESNDHLKVFWSANGTTFNLLADHTLNDLSMFVHNSIVLPVGAENLGDLTFRFEFDGNMGNDQANVDNVLLSGTPLATPLPGALPLFASGLGALGLLRWRRRRKAT